ncbi:hypothetical protein [Streptomyces tendae]|uniref:hypothetical protein n=1 Tax=Streptomyces tendae TaxID=1932 RepID=UPI0033B98757
MAHKPPSTPPPGAVPSNRNRKEPPSWPAPPRPAPARPGPPRPRICPACDGFASVAITTGGRNARGHLRTITAHCPTCHGSGITTRHSREGARA